LRRLGIPRSFPTIKNQTRQGTFPGSLVRRILYSEQRNEKESADDTEQLLPHTRYPAWILGKPAWFPLINDAFPVFFLIFCGFLIRTGKYLLFLMKGYETWFFSKNRIFAILCG